ncbi:hypothetical protein M5K25_017790 [Dendrobium thyrsiflorum]|uniref:WRKY domain-containing protein n=1 Tax=Dendrobium thyrsiflorum TaxID=117978 RepID=A0ABD0UNJ2_DENTH
MASSTSTIIAITIREDDYKWRKYGKKYILKIEKYRCVNKNCKARKKVEWPPNEPNNIDIAYEGDHNHRALAAGRSENEEGGIPANQYDLATQMDNEYSFVFCEGLLSTFLYHLSSLMCLAASDWSFLEIFGIERVKYIYLSIMASVKGKFSEGVVELIVWK